MADILFCLDIHKDSVAAVVVDRSSKITVVTACGVADTLDQSFEDAIEQIKEQTGFAGGPCLVTLGAELFSFRNVSLSVTATITTSSPFTFSVQAVWIIKSWLL